MKSIHVIPTHFMCEFNVRIISILEFIFEYSIGRAFNFNSGPSK